MPRKQTATAVTFQHKPENDIAIRARRLSKTYAGSKKQGPHQALKAIDLDIPTGKIFGLLGPNGAGKSTFINIMAGTVIKSSGTMSVWNTDIDSNPRQARANIGIVPQELNVDAYFTPRQTVEMTAGLFGVPKSERRTDDILEMVGLTDQADFYARRLSGGMRRRLLVAKAMVHSPPILVLDEPTAGVDVALRQKLWDNILMLNDQGVTIVLTTHYLEEAERLCRNIAIIDSGEIVENTSMQELLTRLEEETFIFDLLKPINKLPEVSGFEMILENPKRIKVTVDKEQGLNAVFKSLSELGIEISSMRNETGRLEELFLGLVEPSLKEKD